MKREKEVTRRFVCKTFAKSRKKLKKNEKESEIKH